MWFLALILLVDFTEASDKCVWAVGNVTCAKDPSKVANLEVRLIDWDGGTIFDPDDDMGFGLTNQDGTFRVEGCGSDFGPWNDPDPYIKIYHKCNGDSVEETETHVIRIFVPETTDFGTIRLDNP